MSEGLIIADAATEDHDAVLALNQAARPHVNGLSSAGLRQLVGWSCYCRVARRGSDIAGFLLALPPGLAYSSLNYRWFSERYTDFVYIDRVAVAPAHQRRGLGVRLYGDLLEFSQQRTRHIACEVNVRPRNEPSLRFHERLGFRAVGSQPTEGGAKTVSLLMLDLANGVPAAKHVS